MKKITILLMSIVLTACGVSDEEIKIAERECAKMVEENNSHVYETKVFDVYSKDGKVVAEVGYKGKYTKENYRIRYCVIDMDNGRISLPSLLNQSKWEK